MNADQRKEEEIDLMYIEQVILPELRKDLAKLESPDYVPDDNADDELREQDIEYLRGEIAVHERTVAKFRRDLGLEI
jgi:hypothetical protein